VSIRSTNADKVGAHGTKSADFSAHMETITPR
jgi:hypothetical protein